MNKDQYPAQHWLVYMLLASDQKLYTGITTNIKRRWHQHRSKKGAKFFYGRQPLALCYLEGEHNRKSASQREWQIKQLSHQKKWELIFAHYGPFNVT